MGKTVYTTESGEPVHGVLAEFETPAAVYHAAEMVRDAGYRRWDVHSPFPIHGIERAMGIKMTKLPLLVAAGGFTGAFLGWLMQWWMSGVDYQLVVQGKPYGAWEPFMPIIFESGVLFAAFAAVFGMLAMNGLPRWHHPLFKSERFLSTSDDRFFLCIEAGDEQFEPERVRELLESAGAVGVELVEE
jgi:hypothetical protein